MVPSIKYDKEVRILKIRLKLGKSVDSEIRGNVVLDYNSKGEVIGLDVMEFDLEKLVSRAKKAKG